jgi:hypothetical protein
MKVEFYVSLGGCEYRETIVIPDEIADRDNYIQERLEAWIADQITSGWEVLE